jgi:hypothetical protein
MNADIDTQALSVATQVIGLDAKWLRPFDVEDTFNNNLRLRGFLCQKPDHRYGALVITHVGEAEVPQLILATPKLHYPFGKDGSFHFPPVKRIHLYEKLDGTNVFAYHYQDVEGRRHQTYKLRLVPTLRNSQWGAFLDMWLVLLVPLLAEDYEPRDIEGFRPHIEKCIHHVMHEFEFKERVVEAYDKVGVSIHADQAAVMCALSKDFPRGEMKKVYAIIVGNR